MAKLTEQETEIEVGKFKASFLALYNDGKLDTILLYLEVDGNAINFHHTSQMGGHSVVRSGKRTNVLEVLEIALKKKWYTIIENQIKIYETGNSF